ncbi:DNA-binding protein [Novosphingobium sp. JCM 18896]|uniref:DNA-binding protein n=1 Tax=Novosphingobium sp. JCM 18896 TaxID=2989731 RepID=UPI002222BF47|nr:DNA-binding protein [Novosphingobium sp. JCM 18896]MCW1429353.1 DNA-binding protein [Novosphingobium sp. JCM 18896]
MADDAFARALEPGACPFVNPKLVAYYLGVSLRYLEQLRARGEGPRYRRHCRRISYHAKDVVLWSESTGGGGKIV